MVPNHVRTYVWTEIRTVTYKLFSYSESYAIKMAAYRRQMAPRTVHPPDLLVELHAFLDAHWIWIKYELPDELRRVSWHETLDPERTDETYVQFRDQQLRRLHRFAVYMAENHRANSLTKADSCSAQHDELRLGDHEDTIGWYHRACRSVCSVVAAAYRIALEQWWKAFLDKFSSH